MHQFCWWILIAFQLPASNIQKIPYNPGIICLAIGCRHSPSELKGLKACIDIFAFLSHLSNFIENVHFSTCIR